MTAMYPFTAGRGGTVTTAPSASNVDTTFPGNGNGNQLGCLLVTNAGASIAFVRVQNTTGAVAASAIDCPVLPNAARLLWVGYRTEPFTVSVFAPAATTVYLTPGEGGIF